MKGRKWKQDSDSTCEAVHHLKVEYGKLKIPITYPKIAKKMTNQLY